MPDEPKNERDRPRRLRRLNEVWTPRGRPVFFVTICAADRRPWLDRPEIHQAFVDFCAQSPERVGAWVGKYVLMPDHVHLFVSVEGPQALSRWVGALKSHLAKVRRKIGEVPPGAQPRPTPSLNPGTNSACCAAAYGQRGSTAKKRLLPGGLVRVR